MSPQKHDKATTDFKSFLAEDISKYAKYAAEQLRNFCHSTIQVSMYQELSFVLKLLQTLSHGQVLGERGFSLNKNILKTGL